MSYLGVNAGTTATGIFEKAFTKVIPLVAEMEQLKEKVKQNGHFKNLSSFNFDHLTMSITSSLECSRLKKPQGSSIRILQPLINIIDYMSKTLCLDFGNTRLKIALFENEEFKEMIVFKRKCQLNICSEIIEQHQPSVFNSFFSSKP